MPMNSQATAEGTARYTERFRGHSAAGHFREAHGLALSSLGIGTYLGAPDDKIDASYTAAVVAAVENRINLIDAAIYYRFHCTVYSIRAALYRLPGSNILQDG